MKQDRGMKLHSFEEAASILGLKSVTLRTWARRGQVSSVKLGRRRLLSEEEIHRLISENTVPARAALGTRR
jgi:excisionase family DNA binding protein